MITHRFNASFVFFLIELFCVFTVTAAEGDPDKELKKKFIGTYILVTVDSRSRAQFNAVCEIKEGKVLVDEKEWGTWAATSATTLLISPSNPSNGEVKLTRKTPDGLIGQETKDSGVSKWAMTRVYVVSKWLHQAGNHQPIEMPLWSTGRAFKPDGRIKWKVIPGKQELVLEWPETTDRCKLSSDGNRYEGRNENGTLITGKKIP